MKRQGIYLLAACVLALGPATASAAEGWYAGAYYGTSDADDIQFGTALGTVTTTFDDGSAMGLVVGKEHGPVRLEIEWSERDFDVEDHVLGGAALPGPTGEVDVSSFFLNGYYHFNADGRFSPYLGAGVGYADAEFDDFGVTPVPEVLRDDDAGFAWQLMAGVEARLGSGWRLFADYRWLAADGLGVTVSPAAGGLTSEVDLETQTMAIGVRYTF